MFETFTRLAQANVDHYNNHPIRHNLITTVLGVAGFVATVKISQRLGGVPKN